MKLKLRLDKKAIQAFFIENVEKIVFGGFIICFLLIVYGAVRRDSYQKAPQELVARAGEAEQNYQRTVPTNADPRDPRGIDYAKIALSSQTEIKEDAFRFAVRWNPPLFEQTSVRKKPELYAVEELHAFADRGAVASEAATAAGSSTKGERWVVLTGAVPKKRQSDAFKKALGDLLSTADQADVVPAYRSFIVERAEVTGRGGGEEPEWQDLTEERERADQGTSSADSFSQDLIDPAIADGLPSLVGKVWNVTTIYHERLTGPALDTVRENPEKYKGKKTTWQGDVNNLDGATLVVFRASSAEDPNAEPMFFAVDYGTKDAAESAQGGAVAGTILGGKKVTIKESASDDPTGSTSRSETVPLLKFDPTAAQQFAPGEGRGGEARRGERSPMDRDATRGAGAGEGKIEVPEYVLFRFFDFSAEPGKQYRYRVRLVLNNPNYQKVENPELAEEETLETPATATSKPISLPVDVRLLAASVKAPPPTLRAGEPTGQMMVVKWEQKNGLEAFKEFPAYRGTVADFPGCTFPEEKGTRTPRTPKPPKNKKAEASEDPTGRTPARGKKAAAEGEELPARPTTKGRSRELDDTGMLGARDAGNPAESFSVDYLSGAVVLDMVGGAVIPGKDRSLLGPGEILVVDADGTLQVHRELDDKAEYDRRLNPPAPPTDRRSEGREGRGR